MPLRQEVPLEQRIEEYVRMHFGRGHPIGHIGCSWRSTIAACIRVRFSVRSVGSLIDHIFLILVLVPVFFLFLGIIGFVIRIIFISGAVHGRTSRVDGLEILMVTSRRLRIHRGRLLLL